MDLQNIKLVVTFNCRYRHVRVEVQICSRTCPRGSFTSMAEFSVLVLILTCASGECARRNTCLHPILHISYSLHGQAQPSRLRTKPISKALSMVAFRSHQLAIAPKDGTVRLANGMCLISPIWSDCFLTRHLSTRIYPSGMCPTSPT